MYYVDTSLHFVVSYANEETDYHLPVSYSLQIILWDHNPLA